MTGQPTDELRAWASGGEPPPSSKDDFNFDDESTAVIAPDRARELLEAEAKRNAPGKTPEPPAKTAAPPADEPLAVSFDDEATSVIGSDTAEKLLEAQSAKTPSEAPPGFPEVPDAQRSEGRSESGAKRGESLDPNMPSVVVAAKATEGPAAAQPLSKTDTLPATRDIIRGFQNEPTRVVRTVKKKSQIPWLLIALSLIAAGAGGFILSEILARHHPAKLKAP